MPSFSIQRILLCEKIRSSSKNSYFSFAAAILSVLSSDKTAIIKLYFARVVFSFSLGSGEEVLGDLSFILCGDCKLYEPFVE